MNDYNVPKVSIIPLEKVINTIVENLIKGGIIEQKDSEHYRAIVTEMGAQEMIETLLDSHAIVEADKRIFQQLHIMERKN